MVYPPMFLLGLRENRTVKKDFSVNQVENYKFILGVDAPAGVSGLSISK